MGLADPAIAASAVPCIKVEVVYCAGRSLVDRSRVRLPAGASLDAAVAASAVLERHPGLVAVGALEVGVWGKISPRSRTLRDGDRVELYRPLQLAPMEARRQRHREQRRGRAAAAARPAADR